MINSKRLAALCGVFFLTSVVTAVAVSPYTDISDKTDLAMTKLIEVINDKLCGQVVKVWLVSIGGTLSVRHS